MSETRNVPTAAFLCLLAGGVAIAFAPIFVRMSDTGPVASAFWRTALAAPLLWLWALRERGTVAPSPGGTRALIASGAFFAADLGVWHWSITYTTVANSTLLANLTPIVVTLVGWFLWRQAVTRTFLAGMALAIAGMFVLVGPHFSSGGPQLLGDGLAALAAVFYASYMLAIKVARDAGASAARVMAWSSSICAAILLPIAWLSPQPLLPASAGGWYVLVGLALVTQVLGQGLIAYAFAHLPASLSSVGLLIQPVVAAVLAWMLFGEAIGVVQLAGGALVLCGIWLSKRGS